jgi:hypothetical protein
MARIIPRDGNAEIRAIGWRVKGVSGRMSRPAGLFEDFKSLSIYNHLAQLIREEEITFKEKTFTINTGDLVPGVYHLKINNSRSVSVSKRFLISR